MRRAGKAKLEASLNQPLSPTCGDRRRCHSSPASDSRGHDALQELQERGHEAALDGANPIIHAVGDKKSVEISIVGDAVWPVHARLPLLDLFWDQRSISVRVRRHAGEAVMEE